MRLKGLLVTLVSIALTWAAAALLMNIAERKIEGRLMQKCPCPSESCPHPARS